MKELVPDALLEHVARRFRVLGDASRLAIVRFLLVRGEANVGEVVEALAMSQANVSKHLRTLLDAGVVVRRQEGTSAYYAVADGSVEQLCSIVCDRIQEQARLDSVALGLR
ncbi:MAG: transcriptional regulator [Chloroflexota bacterium]